ncbi:uncharacterized protein BXZ73DRAFT_81501 [Epithele typhae]|uniref:uncharacterized protein n=1 Tax=Epithele typhae TaxID=378194 RepID=UPI0020082ABC|nr:uncharacterized protein BXZ73DRAFT_81501 [Epithele typhae]KAH9914889.1 hypothetical protein BXZ73DRAFT_81501 [Epithele typhae]
MSGEPQALRRSPRRPLPEAKLYETGVDMRSELKRARSNMRKLLKQNKRDNVELSDLEELDPGICSDEDDDYKSGDETSEGAANESLEEGEVDERDATPPPLTAPSSPPHPNDDGDESREEGELDVGDPMPPRSRTPPSPPKPPSAKRQRATSRTRPAIVLARASTSVTTTANPHAAPPPVVEAATDKNKRRNELYAARRRKQDERKREEKKTTAVPHNALPDPPKGLRFVRRYINADETVFEEVSVAEYKVEKYGYQALHDPVKTKTPPTVEQLEDREYSFLDWDGL